MATKIQHRRGTAAAWTSANPTLAAGEPAYETDTGKVKVGDGATAWTSLAYFGSGVDSSGVRRTVVRAQGGALAGVSATAYHMSSSGVDQSAPAPSSLNGQNIFPVRLAAADFAVTGKTPKLRIRGLAMGGTNPNVTVTFGLYPVTIAATITLGTVISGSTVSATVAALNTATEGESAAFDLPTDGLYALGYTLNATPAAAVKLHASLQLYHV